MTDYANRKITKREFQKRSVRPRYSSILLALLFAAPVVVMVFVAILTSLKGSELVAIEGQIENVVSRNRELKDKIVAEGSLTKLGESAQVMGMVHPDHIVYVERQSSARASIK